MNPTLTANTQVILMLTAPFLTGRGESAEELLTPAEYRRLALHLRGLQRQPSDLMGDGAAELLNACQTCVPAGRLKKLLGRGFPLSQAVDRWRTRSIWVISRADELYPRRLKNKLREDAPAVLYGCGNLKLLDRGGLAVVGSRHAGPELLAYAHKVGRLSAGAGRAVLSGGARGIDQAAMQGALDGGGMAIGVLADSLERAALARENRTPLMTERLVLVSPYDPGAGFQIGHAMQRNKLVYALADAGLVVSSDYQKGGTWAGAVEQLEKLSFVPVYVRPPAGDDQGMLGLRSRGALVWPEPQGTPAFVALLSNPGPPPERIKAAVSQRRLFEGETLYPIGVPPGAQGVAEPSLPWPSPLPAAMDGQALDKDA